MRYSLSALAADGLTLGFAMNAGMYHRDLSPVGLFVADGRQTAIRDERRFDGVEALKAQIAADVRAARVALGN